MPEAKKSQLEGLQKVVYLANTNKLSRFLAHPRRYGEALFFKKFVYPRSGQAKLVEATTFWGGKMHVLLPASTDIYLTGGKTHNSEIRLARFFIQQLEAGDQLVDIGAHYGYFSLLAASLVGRKGQVIAFEASENSVQILRKNTDKLPGILVRHNAISDESGSLDFYEFPNLFSEFNSLDQQQFEKEEWFAKAQPRKIRVEAISIDDLAKKIELDPKIIKIDVEGAELKVIEGAKNFLQTHQPMLILEYLSKDFGNKIYAEAFKRLQQVGYFAHKIEDNGSLSSLNQQELEAYLSHAKLRSDNIVFMKI